MEKFLFTFKLSKSIKFVGWFKFVINCFIAVMFLIGSILSTAVLDVLKKILKSENDSSNFSKFIKILQHIYENENFFIFRVLHFVHPDVRLFRSLRWFFISSYHRNHQRK